MNGQKQVFRLVKGGRVDRKLAFDKLPESLLAGIDKGSISGLPRHWKRELGVNSYEKNVRPFYVLDYIFTNKDKVKWSEIVSYVRRNAPKEQRLLDNLEDMAVPMAPDSYSQMTLEPEDIPVIRVGNAEEEVEETEESIEAAPVSKAPVKKRRRRRRMNSAIRDKDHEVVETDVYGEPLNKEE